ncbi:MAG: ParB/RepB/Spo0J family partition protein [Aristaeellaceae bacterium]
MEHNIVMIPVEALRHHPDNPRREIGDVKELAASIRESGVMQNLTVVPNPADEETWLVVIGNRRLEAAKKAGLSELPCYISDMDHKQQIATMMAENMQRIDLTLVEQAQGVQMMMDLGMDAQEISRRTGIRRDAVERRAALNRYNAEKVSAAVAKGGTISDFIELEKIRDEKKREELLAYIGTSNYRNKVSSAMAEQKQWDIVREMAGKLETFATRIEKAGEVNGRKQAMMDIKSWAYPAQKDVEGIQTPEDVKERRYYYKVEAYPAIRLYAEVADAEDIRSRQKQEKNKQKMLEEAYREKYRQAETTWKRMRDMRADFVRKKEGLKLDEKYLLKELAMLTVERMANEEKTMLATMLEAETEDVKELADRIARQPAYGIACMTIAKLDSWWMCRPYEKEYTDSMMKIRHKKNSQTEKLYEVLTEMGYEISDEEIAMLCGTHEVFEPVEGQEK